MKGRAALKSERLIRLTWMIAHGQSFTSKDIRERFGVTASMAERDLRQLEKVLHPDAKPDGKKRWRRRVVGRERRVVQQLGGE